MKVMTCHVCNQKSLPLAKTRILNKYDIQYFQCGECGFIQTEFPYWLEEAYSDAINDSDIGLVGRNHAKSKLTYAIISIFFDGQQKFLDYGGGYGLFVRLMRDTGLDFYQYDKFCKNLFAKTFDVDLDKDDQFELVTAFEVFEHLVHPLEEIEKMLQFSKNILFSTTLVPPNNPKPDEWWYYGLDHGQHISLYTRTSLEVIAEKFKLKLITDGNSTHLLTSKTISPLLFRTVSRYKTAVLLNLLFRRKSLLPDDYFKITGRHLK